MKEKEIIPVSGNWLPIIIHINEKEIKLKITTGVAKIAVRIKQSQMA